MNKDELKGHNGNEGMSSYIAYDGKVYDVSASNLWKGGIHMGRHKVGEDLTDFLPLAPHGPEVFQRVREAGSLEVAPPDRAIERMAMLRRLYHRLHPHPIVIHFPMGLFVFAALMQVVFFMTSNASFETAAFYAVVVATLGAIPSMGSGMLSWWINYDMTLTSIFRNKLLLSVMLIAAGGFLVVVRLMIPEISSRLDILSYFYNGALLATAPLTMLLGYNGGRITWPQ